MNIEFSHLHAFDTKLSKLSNGRLVASVVPALGHFMQLTKCRN